MYKLLLTLFLVSTSQLSYASFCDSEGGVHSVTKIHVFRDKAYVNFTPPFVGGGESESCKKDEFVLDLTEENVKSYYPLLMTALVTGKQIRATYCGACVPHGYHGSSVKVPVLEGLMLEK